MYFYCYVYSVLCVLFHFVVLCKCVLYYCHRVSTESHLTNISYHIYQERNEIEVSYTLQPRISLSAHCHHYFILFISAWIFVQWTHWLSFWSSFTATLSIKYKRITEKLFINYTLCLLIMAAWESEGYYYITFKCFIRTKTTPAKTWRKKKLYNRKRSNACYIIHNILGVFLKNFWQAQVWLLEEIMGLFQGNLTYCFTPSYSPLGPFVYRSPLDYMNAVSIMFSYSHVSAHVYDVCNDYLHTMLEPFRDP